MKGYSDGYYDGYATALNVSAAELDRLREENARLRNELEPVAWNVHASYFRSRAAMPQGFCPDCIPLYAAPVVPADDARDAASIKRMVDAFLRWRLPDDFSPDSYVTFDAIGARQNPLMWPTGTNLLHAGQAEELMRVLLAAMKEQP